jgi:uncharacterized membrane protein YeaQ/YmgE (transglycosylase-associated protein family)
VGLVAGVLASLIVGGIGYGLVGDILVGIVGAFVGVVLLLFLVRVIRSATVRRR